MQSISATAHATAAATTTTPKKQRTVLSSRHTDDDLKCGNYEYITEDSKSSVLFILVMLNYCCSSCSISNF